MGETNWKEGLFVFLVICCIVGIVVAIMASQAGAEVSGINHIVELQDGLVITSSLTTEVKDTSRCILDWCPTKTVYVPSVKAGDIVTSEDGSTCWVATDFGTTIYYRILAECP